MACQTVTLSATTYISFHEYVMDMITESLCQENQRESHFLRGRSKQCNLAIAIKWMPEKIEVFAYRVVKPALSPFSVVTPASDCNVQRVKWVTSRRLLSPLYLLNFTH